MLGRDRQINQVEPGCDESQRRLGLLARQEEFRAKFTKIKQKLEETKQAAEGAGSLLLKRGEMLDDVMGKTATFAKEADEFKENGTELKETVMPFGSVVGVLRRLGGLFRSKPDTQETQQIREHYRQTAANVEERLLSRAPEQRQDTAEVTTAVAFEEIDFSLPSEMRETTNPFAQV
jgi:hypothetical protein